MKIEREDIHALFHKLWTKAVGTESYVKTEWIELERKIIELVKVERRKRERRTSA